MNDKMKCFGCKNDKPRTDFDKNPALCRTCVMNASFDAHRRSSGKSKSSGGGIVDAIGDFFEAVIDGITGN